MQITSKFSKDLVHIFLTRTGFILNKIHQTRVFDFETEEFTWHYEEPIDENESLLCFLTIRIDELVIDIFWSGEHDVNLAKIESNLDFLNFLDQGDNIFEFTKIETHVVKKLIELEKIALAESLLGATDYISRIGTSDVKSIADSLLEK